MLRERSGPHHGLLWLCVESSSSCKSDLPLLVVIVWDSSGPGTNINRGIFM